MGFFDFLFGKTRGPGGREFSFQVGRLVKKITNPNQQPLERKHAIETLGQMNTQEAAEALVLRFRIKAEQTIADDEEKALTSQYLINMGEIAVEPLKNYIKTEVNLYWAIKTLAGIIGNKATVDFLLDEIDQAEAIFERDVQRKLELVSNLALFDDERVIPKLKELLHTEENEEIKVRALEGLADHADKDMIRYLTEVLVDPATSQRIRNMILHIAVEKRWKMKYLRDKIKEVMPARYWMDDVGVIHNK